MYPEGAQRRAPTTPSQPSLSSTASLCPAATSNRSSLSLPRLANTTVPRPAARTQKQSSLQLPMLATAANYLTGEPMKFNESELQAIQFPRSEHYGVSATYSASLTMGNCVKIHAKIDALRRVDGTVTAADVKAVYLARNVQLDEWAQGEVNFAEIADDFNEGREPEPIADVIRDSLISMKLEWNTATLVQQLERNDYAKVNKILEALGGKWNKKAGAHVFGDADPEEAIASYLETGKLDKPQKFGFFPTPDLLGRELVKLSGLKPGDTVLEPESGVGDLALICAEIVGTENVACYEIQSKNCDVLRAKGLQVVEVDFLQVQPTFKVSKVIMNPPFERQADIEHVLHAYNFLEPGGVLAAIMSLGVTFRSNAKTVRFREFLSSMNAKIVVNDAGAFKASGTLAQTISIVFERPQVDQALDPVFDNATSFPFHCSAPAGAGRQTIPPSQSPAPFLPAITNTPQSAFAF
jgi:predicted RNA methylase